jgi:TetR/AcrR family transcriptional regulator
MSRRSLRNFLPTSAACEAPCYRVDILKKRISPKGGGIMPGVRQSTEQPSAMKEKASARPKPGTAPRRKGRPASADASVGRERLLALAIDFLQTHPVSQLTMARVAQAGGVDPALVRYYFGSLDGLLIELISKLLAGRTASGLRYLSDTGPVEHRFKRRVRAILQENAKHPFFHDLLVERIFRSDDAAAKAVLQDLAQRGLHMATKLIEDGKNSGELRAADPAFLHMLVVGACTFFVSGGALVEALRQRPTSERTLDAFADFLVDVLMNGLRPR